MFPLRDENPSHRTPYFTVGLICLNTLLFLYELALGPEAEGLIYRFGILPIEIWHNENLPQSLGIPAYLTLVTSMFLHGGFGHLIGNMWFLWIFGDNLEDVLGHFRFLVFYFVTGIAAGLMHAIINPDSAMPTIGASGAISGVLGGYLVLFPSIRIRTLLVLGFFINVVRVPALFFLGLWFVMQALGGLGGPSQVAFGAHIGGFIAGVIYIALFTRRAPTPTHRYDPHRLSRW